ncbi:MAG: hypothetical protein HC859_15750 [Bacteroidia bacterium]|nr:hypothetical protein [Bacteroidia bacterium]
MDPKPDEVIGALKRWDYVTVTLHDGETVSAYVGEVDARRMELLIVLNAYRHFSNISDPPEVEPRWIDRSDIASIKK